jgi:hypothetical protein
MPAPPKKQPVPVAVQVRLAQQGWLTPPQAWQRLSNPHPSAEPQRRFAQQGWPSPPQALQAFPLPEVVHTVLAAVQALPAQQGWLAPPQAWQVGVSPAQTVPAVAQVRPAQQA